MQCSWLPQHLNARCLPAPALPRRTALGWALSAGLHTLAGGSVPASQMALCFSPGKGVHKGSKEVG